MRINQFRENPQKTSHAVIVGGTPYALCIYEEESAIECISRKQPERYAMTVVLTVIAAILFLILMVLFYIGDGIMKINNNFVKGSVNLCEILNRIAKSVRP